MVLTCVIVVTSVWLVLFITSSTKPLNVSMVLLVLLLFKFRWTLPLYGNGSLKIQP
ncbi:hypothetical protein D3C87_1289920 [compost metagenome]